jgi:putative Mg2+ transporter-C (MgtC) family protein
MLSIVLGESRTMDAILQAIGDDLNTLRPGGEFWQSVFRLLVAAIMGGILGYERERDQQAAGLRTHMLVTIGSALFVLLFLRAGGAIGDLSRVMQGVVTGIGFLGAGAILKRDQENTIHGITTAAGIWMSTAIGMSAGLGRLDLAVIATVLGWLVLAILKKLGHSVSQAADESPEKTTGTNPKAPANNEQQS